MEHISDLIGHLAWPMVALIIAYWLVRELKNGLINELLPNGGTVKAAGVEVEIRAAGRALAAAGVKAAPAVEEATAEAVIEDDAPYETVIGAWREVSYQIANLAAKHGGRRDARRSYENIALLEEKGLLPDQVANAARSLFRARNSFRRLRPEELTEEIASDFKTNAEALSGYLRLIE